MLTLRPEPYTIDPKLYILTTQNPVGDAAMLSSEDAQEPARVQYSGLGLWVLVWGLGSREYLCLLGES